MTSTSALDQELIPEEENKVYVAETPTPYQDVSCCGCRCAYFSIGKFKVCGHWISKPLKPVLIILFFLLHSALGVYDIILYSTSLGEKIVLIIILGIAILCIALSYLEVIIIGPSYLPFNYKYKKSPYSWEDMMSSMVVYKEQMEFARESERPPRASFAISARRFVLRADHYCYWTESWIGLTNARYFLLMLFWVDFYCLYWMSYHAIWIIYMVNHSGFMWQYILSAVGFCAMLVIVFVSLYHSFLSFRDLCHNWTSLERWKNRVQPVYDLGCIGNFEEVCGDRRYRCLWPFPCYISKPTQDGFYA